MGDFQTLLVQIILVPTVCGWILAPNRFANRTKALALAVLFLAGCAIVSETISWQSKPPSFYDLVEIDRVTVAGNTPGGASGGLSGSAAGASAELQRAYRKQTLKW
jgi:hypothetical protein